MSEFRYDVVVAGADVAGTIVSKKIAQKGYKVALVECKPTSIIGKKVCGDGVGLHDFQEAEIDPPTFEAERTVKGVKIYSKSEEPIFKIKGDGFTLDRHKFGQRLLKEAQNEGVELFPENMVTESLLENNRVMGIAARHHGSINKFRASITIDATGIVAAVRTTLPASWPVSERIDRSEIGIGYRQYRMLSDTFEEYCSIYYDWDLAQGGYCWIIPKKNNIVNTGILVPFNNSVTSSELDARFRKFIDYTPMLKDSDHIRSEIGLVPLRHPLPSAVANGFLTIGDAAFHANPLNGDGIGPAMYAAKITSEVAVSCLDKQQYSEDDLWRFNIDYMKTQGYKYYKNKVLADFMRSLTHNEVIQFLKLLGTKGEYESGDFLSELSILDKLNAILKISLKPKLFFRIARTVNKISFVSSHCTHFAQEPESLPLWIKELSKGIARV